MFDASTLYCSVPAFEGSDLSLAAWAKKLTGKPSMAVGGVGLSENLFTSLETGGAVVADNIQEVAERIEREEFDMIALGRALRSEEHTSELQSLMRISYPVFCLKKKKQAKKSMN